MAYLCFTFISILILCSPLFMEAQENIPPAQTSAQSAAIISPSITGTRLSDVPPTPQPYADSAEGMKLQMAKVLQTWWSGDKEKFAEQLNIFAFPAPDAWFTLAFGPEKSSALLSGYQQSFESFKSHIWWVSGNWGNDPALGIKVEPSELPRPAEETGEEGKLPKPIVPVRVENFRFTLTLGERVADNAVFAFVYADGAFRFVGGTYPFWNEALQRIRTSTEAPSRIRFEASVAAAQLLHMVNPEYPRDAKKMHIQGVVHLHAIIGKDGHIKSLQVIDGDPGLAIAAQAAVRQWIYKPTRLNGRPVEVDTTIAVNFTLGSH